MVEIKHKLEEINKIFIDKLDRIRFEYELELKAIEKLRAQLEKETINLKAQQADLNSQNKALLEERNKMRNEFDSECADVRKELELQQAETVRIRELKYRSEIELENVKKERCESMNSVESAKRMLADIEKENAKLLKVKNELKLEKEVNEALKRTLEMKEKSLELKEIELNKQEVELNDHRLDLDIQTKEVRRIKKRLTYGESE